MKKLFAVVLSFALCLGVLAGCSKGSDNTDGSAKFKIGLIQYVEHLSLNTIRESFEAQIKTLGLSDKVEIDYKNAQGEPSNLNSICQKFVSDKVNLIVAIATPAAQAAVAATENTEIPVLFSAVTDPAADLSIQNLKQPEGNVTGTSDLIPSESTLKLAKQIDPNLKKLGLLYNAGETNSVSVIKDAKAFASSNDLEVVEATITNINELQQVATSLVGKVDAIFTPIDNSIASAMSLLADVTRTNKIPMYVGADSMVKDGGLAAVGIDYTNLGKKTAEMAKEFFDGKKTTEIPVVFFDQFSTYINTKTAETIGVPIPDSILDGATKFD